MGMGTHENRGRNRAISRGLAIDTPNDFSENNMKKKSDIMDRHSAGWAVIREGIDWGYAAGCTLSQQEAQEMEHEIVSFLSRE